MKNTLTAAIALLVLLTALPVRADPGTLYVDADGVCDGNASCFSEIQTAVDAANADDTVYVYAGTYYENVTISKPLTLQGEDREATIIDGGGSGDVVHVAANHVTIEGLTITNGENGIGLKANYRHHHLTVRDAIVTWNTHTGIHAPHSRSPSYHLVEDCVISNNGERGVSGDQFSESIIRNCEVFGNAVGIDVGWGYDTIVADNEVHGNRKGIRLDSVWNTVAERNQVWDNQVGVSVDYVARRNTIRENIIRGNDEGIRTNRRYCGNEFYHNDLIENQEQASDRKACNVWDDGYPSGGNYWSDYAGADDHSGPGQDEPGSDGIGDTPYTFEGNQDDYPLMTPWNLVQATVDVDPDTLNLKSKGKWLTAYIELPEGYDVADIDVSTVRLERRVPAEEHPTEMGDYDADGTADLMVKFDQQGLIEYLDGTKGQVMLKVTGNLRDGTPFEAVDVITVKKPGKK